MKVDHLGIAVKDLDAATAVWEALGLRCEGVEEVPTEKARIAMLPVGESRVELLESTHPDGVIARFVEKRGEGLHHIAFAVEDIEAAMARLRDQGFRLLDESPRPGAGGRRVAFIHPKSTSGVLVELVEPGL